MDDHAGLRQGKSQEYPDGEQGDQRVGIAAKDDDQSASSNRQEQDAVGKHQPIPQTGQLARQKAVGGQESCQARKAGKAGVGRYGQDQHRAGLDQHVGRPTAQQPPRQRRQDRLLRPGDHGQDLRQADAAHEQHTHQHGHDHQRPPGIPGLGRLKGRHAVADRLDPGQCRTASGKSLQHQKRRQRVCRAAGAAAAMDPGPSITTRTRP